MGYSLFVKWFNDQINNDSVYLGKNGQYSFVFTFETKKDITNLKPIYPWKSNLIFFFLRNLEDTFSYEKILEERDRQIDYLKKQLIELTEKKK